VSRRPALRGITYCAGCGQPAHASETNDQNLCAACARWAAVPAAATAARALGHLVLRQGSSLECSRCGASGEVVTMACGSTGVTGTITRERCGGAS
jgi:hypothetical protein